MLLNFKFNEAIASQRDNITLWATIFLGLGICAYFGLRTEPGLSPTLLVLAASFIACIAAIAMYRKTGAWGGFQILLGLLFVLVLGFSAAKLRTTLIDHPILQKAMRVTMVEGTIRSMELLEEGKGVRVLLRDLSIDRLPPAETPRQIRMTIRSDDGLSPGQRIRVLGGLNPPSPPVAPGSFDFERDAYFKNIGAFGYAFKPPEVVAVPEQGGFGPALQRYRAMLGHMAEAELRRPESAVVIALLNGDQRALPEDTWNDIRIAGLAHIIAISGANISMAAGIAFFLSRFLMALSPRFALYHPIKVYSAGIAFVAALAYALIVGMNVPTFRALVMTGLVLLAIAVNRSPFSLRMAAMSAFGLLLFYPEFLLGASFQMSFAAVVGLIVFYDLTRNWWTGLHRRANWFGRIFIYVGGIMVITVLATIVTAPFSLANFQQFSPYAVIANALVVPVVDFWIMPLAIVVYFLAPLGLEAWPLHGMEAGVHFMLSVAHAIAGWPFAQLHGAVWPAGALGLMVAGILFTVIWSGRARWLGLAAILLAAVFVIRHEPPDILVAPGLKVAMIRTGEGAALLSTRKSGRFASDVWMKESGIDAENVTLWPREGLVENGHTRLSCEEDGCLAEVKGVRVAFSFHPRTIAQDCREASVVVASSPVRDSECRVPVLIDLWDLKDRGAHAIRVMDNKATIRSVAAEQGQRPWSTNLADQVE